jgi:serine/threonine protein kinase
MTQYFTVTRSALWTPRLTVQLFAICLRAENSECSMCVLHTKILNFQILHRDVALRNVLLKADFTIRVSDFGLSRRAGNDGSYIQTRNLAIPVRYIAPEALRNLRFSKESELWSFGVVLWELFTFARQTPYSGIENCNDEDHIGILHYLDSGQRLFIPDCTPKPVYVSTVLYYHELAPGQF